jgi:hypothetical protein
MDQQMVTAHTAGVCNRYAAVDRAVTTNAGVVVADLDVLVRGPSDASMEPATSLSWLVGAPIPGGSTVACETSMLPGSAT